MDDSLSKALVRLTRNAVRRIAWRRGDAIVVFEGQVWITQDGSPDDTVLRAGESRAFRGDGDLVVEAFADAVLIRLRADDCSNSDAARPPRWHRLAPTVGSPAHRQLDRAVGVRS